MRQDLHISEQTKRKIRHLYMVAGVPKSDLACRFQLSVNRIETVLKGLNNPECSAVAQSLHPRRMKAVKGNFTAR